MTDPTTTNGIDRKGGIIKTTALERQDPSPDWPLDMTALTVEEQPGGHSRRLKRWLWRPALWSKVGLFIVSLFLFMLAIVLMKEGAGTLTPIIQGRLAIDNPLNSLGFGWLFAYIIMSGSPVAASALAFFDAGVISELNTYFMITGSRLGASLIVLVIGFVYILRGRDRANSLSMGLLSMFVTGTTYLVALGIGVVLLSTGILDSFQISPNNLFNSFADNIFDPILAFVGDFMPGWLLFPAGLVVILFSFKLFDKCLPQMTLKESQVGQVSRLVYRPAVMFALGAAVTLVSMSVSLSLGLLVPLSQRGFVRRENVIPYIMGANITTFIDTLFASMLLDSSSASTIVLTGMVSITIVSLILMTTILRHYERTMLSWANWATETNRHSAILLFIALLIPIILVLL